MVTKIKGIVFDIKKFAIHDGPGIRTTVFLKGCPLTCIWCHNPESQDKNTEISFLSEKCIGCGYCYKNCPNQCHITKNNIHVYLRENCKKCAICTRECYAQALEAIGKKMAVKEVLDEVLKDLPFYETSGGGMTISGGEPMSQFEFTRTLLNEAKKKKIHCCMDTSGFAPFKQYRELLPLVDLFLYDLKETDPVMHKEYTGVPLKPILENLKKLDQSGAKIILRCPLIPGLNDRKNHFAKIAEIANGLKNVLEINLQPYHPLGKSKNERIGKEYQLKEKTFPEEKTVTKWLSQIQKLTEIKVRQG